jgi:glycerophosphoryl diester phosphodiesterase
MASSGGTSPSERLDRLIALPFAHRGLHGPGRIENSRAAFAAAVARGHGIELDVRMSRDGAAMVFHDEDLGRLTEATGRVRDRDAAALRQIRLRGSVETIPTLAEILELVAGRAALLIEVKTKRRGSARLCAAVRDALAGYQGAAAIMSFHPEVPRWFAAHEPERLRGLVVTEKGDRRLARRIGRSLAAWRARPHFLAYDIRDLPSPFAALARSRGRRILTWTCRSERDFAVAAAHADQIIYEDPAGPDRVAGDAG